MRARRYTRLTVAYKTFTFKTEVVSVDIPTMAVMSPEEYEQYIRDNFIVDHHDVLREQSAGGYPIAVTQGQIRALIRYLEEIAPMVGDESR
jgi:hypothetical protein